MQNNKFLRTIEITAGIVLILVGIVFFFIPFIPGFVFVLAGLALLGIGHRKQGPLKNS